MSHTYAGKENRFHYNPDLSGPILITNKEVSPGVDLDVAFGIDSYVQINAEDFVGFIRHLLRRDTGMFRERMVLFLQDER